MRKGQSEESLSDSSDSSEDTKSSGRKQRGAKFNLEASLEAIEKWSEIEEENS